MKKTITLLAFTFATALASASNPIVTDVFTADPAAIVHEGTVYIYTGHDEAEPNKHYAMKDWLCFSSQDMKTWTAHGPILAVKDFAWAKSDAYAAHVTEKDGKFYWFVSTRHADDQNHRGMGIGVAVSDSPTGPFEDARGSALITSDMTPKGEHSWEDIDPAVFIDKDGTPWLFWGNVNCYYVKLKPNMIELDGPIMEVEGLENFTEAPWIHEKNGLYYLSYASGFPEKISYATAPSIEGPWTSRGLLAEGAFNSNTIHQSIIEFEEQWYFIYHNGSIQHPNTGDSYRRSVCIDYLYHNPDGTIQSIVQTTEGTDLPPRQ
ncbi:glycoside hydrolase family 43 protein [Pelagicoccus albus]|uniref:Family 43 glycosylhydrolase n=1 Tax=Pelagicoccus albus TaxID=415222 RepID=A0A7X1B6R2_9BACT|nr:glycoside hydrolase family 43 protein [Pelagicoccus albus]MBC2606676.1 family 43 glycosylhydrolase [Pelagicoccus albus]